MSRKTDVKKYILIAVFAFCLVLPLLFINRSGASVSGNENRFLAGIPILITEDGNVNAEYWGEFSAWIGDHIGFRDFAVKTVNEFKMALMHRPTTDLVHIGKEGWLYYNGDGNLQLAENNGAVDSAVLEGSLIRLTQIRDRLAEKGIDFVVVLAPSKATVYPEYMRYGSGETGYSQCDTLADYIADNSDINLIPLKNCLLEAKKNEQVYFKTDTHWNEKGAYFAYCEMLKRLGEFGLCDVEPAEVEFYPIGFNGGLSKMIGDSTEEPTEFLNINGGEKDARRVLVVCDSFFGGWMIPELFEENFSASAVYQNGEITEELLREHKPDIVIYEVTERFQGEMTSFSDDYING